MNTYRILGLDDGNLATCFCCENGVLLDNCSSLVQFLSRPHSYQVEVRVFCLIDKRKGKLALVDEEKIEEMFDYLVGYGRLVKNMVDDPIFESFWESANKF